MAPNANVTIGLYKSLRANYTNLCSCPLSVHTNIHACNVSRGPKLTQITLFKWSAIDRRYHWAADALAFDDFSIFAPKRKPIQTNPDTNKAKCWGINKSKTSINTLLKIKENTGQQFVDVSCEQMIITSYPATFHAVHYIRMSLVVAIVPMITWLYYSLLDNPPPQSSSLLGPGNGWRPPIALDGSIMAAIIRRAH